MKSAICRLSKELKEVQETQECYEELRSFMSLQVEGADGCDDLELGEHICCWRLSGGSYCLTLNLSVLSLSPFHYHSSSWHSKHIFAPPLDGGYGVSN